MDVAAAFWHARAWALCGRWLDPYIGVVAGVGDLVMGWMECWRLASYLTKTCSLDHHAFRSMAVAYFEVEGRGGRVCGTSIPQLVLILSKRNRYFHRQIDIF